MTKLEADLISVDAMNAPLHEIERMLEAQGREMQKADSSYQEFTARLLRAQWQANQEAALARFTGEFVHRGDAPYSAVTSTATSIVAGDAAGAPWFLDWPP